MPHGGRRPNSGRKTNAQIKQAREILNQTMTEDQWKQLFRRLHKLALAGNMRAAALLLDYQFGNPYAEPETEAPPSHIRTIEAHLTERPRPQLDAPRPLDPDDFDSDETADDDDPADNPADTIPAQPKSNEWAELDARYNNDKY